MGLETQKFVFWFCPFETGEDSCQYFSTIVKLAKDLICVCVIFLRFNKRAQFSGPHQEPLKAGLSPEVFFGTFPSCGRVTPDATSRNPASASDIRASRSTAGALSLPAASRPSVTSHTHTHTSITALFNVNLAARGPEPSCNYGRHHRRLK